ncbi:1-deoxy-D-xylulose-5-phosphate reductoisomerase [Modestobacter sp. VKM Ac-2979]|uniref:1-deoxy-D-xylulose-5-phosphate reductoisomerase n=1 Tax=unclassified Modestobacter TaxID=2643866 RepID=UPI0022AB9295|nr:MULTISPECIES: 1-deoxy-D-xylulose-5-phosphate reductoisomerase [unclassified Modestobacter]MCZ2812680.1 1-deoxy-D-xylulose-5-phosphate reductoisomerase [Modestobacter sp. VKM Ac-2979]MCZ2841570.1 1-deoxy-D-xylulose-5-phosphate reductoisomerase [Modestobacter sp. VKM Ac-2980]
MSEPRSTEPRTVTVLGSTGSIGRQAIAVARQNPDRLRVTGLAAGGGDVALLAEQALSLGVRTVAIARATAAQDLQLAFYAAAQQRGWAQGQYALPEILAGPRAAEELATRPADVVLNGITGSIGLRPTLSALAAGRTVALANKESLVAGGALVTAAAAPGQLVPVDSEHSALAQCLRGGQRGEVARLVLTASGGPFRGRTAEELAGVTREQALAHPTWDMGPVVTINSATLVNKGLELIEAHLLFGVPYADIDVVVHPQSIVHSMVTFTDGATIAQASPPDMRLPIALALAWPDRLPDVQPALDWSAASTWEFQPLDSEVFPAVRLARQAGEAGGVVPALYNAANEEAVAAFTAGHLSFPGIVQVIARTLDAAPDLGAPTCVEDVLAAEKWAREHARGAIDADNPRRSLS